MSEHNQKQYTLRKVKVCRSWLKRELRKINSLKITLLAALAVSGVAHLQLQAQDNSVCARARIEIVQELTLERQAFDARLKIANGTPLPVENIQVDILFTDEAGNSVWATNDPDNTGAYFFLRPDGDGGTVTYQDGLWRLPDVRARGTADTADPYVEVHWLIIPSAGAGGEASLGTLYSVGAFLSYTLGGVENTLDVAPDTIRVMPMPVLALDYFLPISVPGDDPATPTVIEPSTPFPLGVRVRNVGYGQAVNLKIDSGQPRIVENVQGLLLSFAITGSAVNGQAVSPSLLVDFGNLAPGGTASAVWLMRCSLTGRFVSFGANVSHADALGGRVTSLIPEENINTHALVKDVLRPGSDAIPDFLGCERDSSGAPEMWTLTVYGSDGVDTPVYDQSYEASLDVQTDGSYLLSKSGYDQDPGPVFISVPDPFNGQAQLMGVLRSDGTGINSRNAWLSREKIDDAWHYTFNIFDVNSAGISYTVQFDQSGTPGNKPPVLQPIADWGVHAGKLLGFVVRASDPEGLTVRLYTGALPMGATFTDQGNDTGRFEWTPGAGQLGAYRVQFVASDGDLTAEQWATITVVEANFNRPPVVENTSLTTAEDTPVSGTMSAQDLEGDAMTWTVVTQPVHGTLSNVDLATGAFTYTPEKDYNGTDSIVFYVVDNKGADSRENASGLGTVTITIEAVDDPPTAASAVITTKQNTPSAPVAPVVEDVDDTVFTISIETQPAHGTAEVKDNKLVYTPADGYFGPDAFTFRATDTTTSSLYVIGNATVTVEEIPFDLRVKSVVVGGSSSPGSSRPPDASNSANTSSASNKTGFGETGVLGTGVLAVVASTRTVAVADVPVELVHRTCSGDTVVASQTVVLQPGDSQVIFEVGTLPDSGVLAVVVNGAGAVSEADLFNNAGSVSLGGAEQAALVSTTALPPAYPPGAQVTVTGRTFYRLPAGENPCTGIPAQAAMVTVNVWAEGQPLPSATASGLTDRNGAWHLPVIMPAPTGTYRLEVTVHDAAGQETIQRQVDVNSAAVQTPPYPGPGGTSAVVSIADSGVKQPWTVSPGTPIPTTGPSGSGVQGGATGTGDSTNIVPNSPAIGTRGGAAPVFDAEVVSTELTVTKNLLEVSAVAVGETVQLSGVVRVNDSYYGLPVVWQVTDPAGVTRDLEPATWYYLNGELHVQTTFMSPTAGTYTVRLSLGPDYTDSNSGNNAGTVAVTVQQANRAPVVQSITVPTQVLLGDTMSVDAQASDADGDALIYWWNFGDGTLISGANSQSTHVYTQTGVFLVSVSVDDGHGGTATQSAQVTVSARPNSAPELVLVTIPASALVGVAAQFGARASDPDGDTLTYEWNFGDTSTVTGEAASHSYGGVGTYTVSVTVSDNRGGTDSRQGQVTVVATNQAPVLGAVSIPAEGAPGVALEFSAKATDPDGDNLTYTWDFGDGTFATAAEASHIYGNAGTYSVSVTVSDGKGGSDMRQGTLTIAAVNHAPVLTGVEIPPAGAPGVVQAFRAAASDADGDTLTYGWDFGDGSTAAVAEAYHAYTASGTYTVSVTVSDGQGGSDTRQGTVSVSVVNHAPVLGMVNIPAVGAPDVALAFGASATDPDGDVLTFTWTFGDGSTGTGAAVSHFYAAPGTYPVTVTVSDVSGASDSRQGSVSVAAVNHAPVLGAVTIPAAGSPQVALAFSAVASDPDGDALMYLWDFGDSTTATTATASHAYTAAGTYPVILTVTDGRGGVVSRQGQTVVSAVNHAPVLGTVTIPSAGAPEVALTFTATATDPDGDALTYEWNFGDNATSGTVEASHTYTAAGIYTVVLTVSDGRGGTVSAQGQVVVSVPNHAPVLGTVTIPGSGVAGTELVFSATASDADGDGLTYTWDFGDGTGGSGAEISHTYTAAGTYPVTVTVTDGRGGKDTRKANTTVVPANHPPTASDANLSTDEDTAITNGSLPATDPDGDTLTWTVVSQPTLGNLTAMDPATGVFTYVPKRDISGTDSFTFKVNDGHLDSATGTVTIVVRPVNDPPTAASAVITTMQDTPSAPVTPEVADVDDANFTITIETQPAHGTAEVQNNKLVYTPVTDYFGSDSFTFRATDSGGLFVIGEAAVTVQEKPFNLRVKSVVVIGQPSSKAGLREVSKALADQAAVVTAVVESTRRVAVPGVAVAIYHRNCLLDEPVTSLTVDLPPGESQVSFDLASLPADGVLAVVVNGSGEVSETDEWDNAGSVNLGGTDYAGLITTMAIPPVLPNAVSDPVEQILSGRTYYRLMAQSGWCTLIPAQAAAVTVKLLTDGQSQPVVSASGLSDRNGAWHVALAMPTDVGSYELEVTVRDATSEETLKRAVVVNSTALTLPPFPGPGGAETVMTIADPNALQPWVVAPGTPIPTTGSSGSGIQGGSTGSGDSTAVIAGSPAIGTRGGVATVFDAQVGSTQLSVSNTQPAAGERVQLAGVVLANDSYYGLPVWWQVTDPTGVAWALAPATWYYANGDLHVQTSFVAQALGSYAVKLVLGPDYTDSESGNDLASITLEAVRPNHAPQLGQVTIPAQVYLGETLSVEAQATDADSDPLTYRWDFGDGTQVSNSTGQATHVYTAAGNYAVGVTAEDDHSGSDTRTAVVSAEEKPNNPPVLGSVGIPADGEIGVAVAFTATATDSDNDSLTYTWDFGDSASAEGATVSHTYPNTGEYTVKVTVSDGRGGSDTRQGTIVVRVPCTSVTVTMDKSSPQTVGSVITFTAAAAGGSGNYEYSFLLLDSTMEWKTEQAYSGNRVWAWDTSRVGPGPYLIGVWARSVGSTADRDVDKYFQYQITPLPATSLEVTVDKGSPQTVGSVITFTAAAAGGSGNYEYYFWLLDPVTGQWNTGRAYNTNPVWVWDTSGINLGTYLVYVWARSFGSTENREVETGFYYTITPPPATSVEVTMDKSSPQTVGSVITFTAAAAGGSGNYEYYFWLLDPVTGQWNTGRAYNTNPVWVWDTSGINLGTYLVYVWARSVGSMASDEAYKEFTYTITPPPATSVEVTMDKSSPQMVGSLITFTAAAAGGSGDYEYYFWLLDPVTGQWNTGRAYNTNPVWVWDTSGINLGTYLVYVWARSFGSTENHEVETGFYYTITSN